MEKPTILPTLLGREPYRWQLDVYELLVRGEIPDALDIPTGLGKTAVIAIWLAARISGAKVPRRLIYVVDRRAVVDQATKEAEKVRTTLKSLLANLAPSAATEWKTSLGIETDELPISTLRGKFADNRQWLQSPVQSSIVVGTVDMIGSRLLFEGYGVSPRMRPVHAALLGTDSLIVIDEAHLVPPFQHLVRQVAAFDRPQPVPAMRLMSLSATGRTGVGTEVFSLTAERRGDEQVAKRLASPKRLRLVETSGDLLAEDLAARALELGKDGTRVLVFCNSRDKTARRVATELQKSAAKKWKDTRCVELLVGARRVAERENLAHSEVFRRFTTSDDSDTSGVPAFLIATSAGEVGVDLDADHMVCDLVAWERMVQRLGRVNRSGREKTAIVDVFVAASPDDDAEEESEGNLAQWRAPFESPLWLQDTEGRLEAGPGALLDLKGDAEFAKLCEEATSPEPYYPELRRAHLEAWSMTSLKEHSGRPRVEPWLRGWIETKPQCKMVWRKVLPMRAERPDRNLLAEFFEALAPHLIETLETETFRARDLIRNRAKQLSPEVRAELRNLAVVALNESGEFERSFGLEQLEDLDERWRGTWVLDARLGGLSGDGLLDSSAAGEPKTFDVPDGDDAAYKAVVKCVRAVRRNERPLDGWSKEIAWPQSLSDEDENPVEWRIEARIEAEAERDASRSRQNQSLGMHHEWAEKEAHAIASKLNLSSAQADLVRTTARVHDLGKNRDLWQTAMGAPREGRPFAKVQSAKANGRALNRYRHEFGSLGDGESEIGSLSDESRELARHILAAHHGLARPVIEPLDPHAPPSICTAKAQQAALRFAKLQQQWGPWGLAWWETLLRAADWNASAKLDKEPGREAAAG